MEKLYKLNNGYYYIFFQNGNGKENKKSTRTKNRLKAQKFYEDFLKKDKLQSVQKEIEIDTPSITLGEFTDRFLSYSKIFHSIKTYNDYRTTIKKLFDFIDSSTQLNKISLREINTFVQSRMNESIHGARRDVINIKAMFNKAVSEDYLISNPCAKLKRIKIPERQPLFFTQAEFSKLINVIDEEEFIYLVKLAVYTGLRQMEILELKWRQIDLKLKLIILDNHNHITKSKKIRTVPINQSLFEMLTKKKTNSTSEFVFTLNGTQIKADFLQDRFRKYIKKANINSKLHFHSLRHTFASWLVQKGVSIYTVSKLLGHQSVQTTMIYAHLNRRDLEDAVNLI